MHGKDGHGINNCKHAPSVEEQAGLDRSIWVRVGAVQAPLGKMLTLPSNLLASRERRQGPPTSQVLPLNPTLAQAFLAQFMYSLVLGRGCTPFQCQTRRGSR